MTRSPAHQLTRRQQIDLAWRYVRDDARPDAMFTNRILSMQRASHDRLRRDLANIRHELNVQNVERPIITRVAPNRHHVRRWLRRLRPLLELAWDAWCERLDDGAHRGWAMRALLELVDLNDAMAIVYSRSVYTRPSLVDWGRRSWGAGAIQVTVGDAHGLRPGDAVSVGGDGLAYPIRGGEYTIAEVDHPSASLTLTPIDGHHRAAVSHEILELMSTGDMPLSPDGEIEPVDVVDTAQYLRDQIARRLQMSPGEYRQSWAASALAPMRPPHFDEVPAPAETPFEMRFQRLAPQLQRDLMIYGNAFATDDGERLDPTRVVIDHPPGPLDGRPTHPNCRSVLPDPTDDDFELYAERLRRGR